jgi:hypothetical protein
MEEQLLVVIMVLLGIPLHLAQSHLPGVVTAAAGLTQLQQNLEEMVGLAVVVAVVAQLQTLAAQEIPHQLAQHKVVMVGIIVLVAAVAGEDQIKAQWLLVALVPVLQVVTEGLVLHLLFLVLQ